MNRTNPSAPRRAPRSLRAPVLAPVLASFLASVLACDAEDAEHPTSADAAGVPAHAPAPPSPPAVPMPPRPPALDAKPAPPSPPPPPFAPMPDARAAFDQVRELVDGAYVEGPLSEDFVWTAATHGLLERLIQLDHHRVNTLLTPSELAELEVGVEGKMTGIGVVIENVGGVIVIREVLPNGPAMGVGLQAGDRLLGVDGTRISGHDLRAAVDRIRGPVGSTADLFVQRDTEEWTVTITRDRIAVVSVRGTLLEDGIGHVSLATLTKGTADELDRVLADLSSQGATRFVLDLRGCPGGLFEAALAVASRFLPNDAPVVTVQDRDGARTEHRTEGDGAYREAPVVVLIDAKTASGGELIAGALGHEGRATLVGERTLGKGTVESIHELGNGWAVKLSISRFMGPDGLSHQGVGRAPDVRVDSARPEDGFEPGSDPQLDAARHLLRAR